MLGTMETETRDVSWSSLSADWQYFTSVALGCKPSRTFSWCWRYKIYVKVSVDFALLVQNVNLADLDFEEFIFTLLFLTIS